jgi:hypothetical protein
MVERDSAVREPVARLFSSAAACLFNCSLWLKITSEPRPTARVPAQLSMHPFWPEPLGYPVLVS